MMHQGRDLLIGFALSLIAFFIMIQYSPADDPRFVDGGAYLPPHQLSSYYATRMFTEPIIEGIVEQSKGRLVASSDSSPVYVNFAVVQLVGGGQDGLCELTSPKNTLPCGEYLLISLTNDEPLVGVWIVDSEAPVVNSINGNQAELLIPSNMHTSLNVRLLIDDGVANSLPKSGSMNIVLLE